MNKVLLIGNLSRDIELRTTQSGANCARFSLAVNRPKDKDGKSEADFINITAWGKTAELCGKYLAKGRKVCIEGSIRTGSYEKDGRKVYTTEVWAEKVEFLPSANGNHGTDVGDTVSEPQTDTSEFTKIKADDDLPF